MRGIGVFGLCAVRREAGRTWENSCTGKGQGKDKSKTFLYRKAKAKTKAKPSYKRCGVWHRGDGQDPRCSQHSHVWRTRRGATMAWAPKVMTWSGPTTRW